MPPKMIGEPPADDLACVGFADACLAIAIIIFAVELESEEDGCLVFVSSVPTKPGVHSLLVFPVGLWRQTLNSVSVQRPLTFVLVAQPPHHALPFAERGNVAKTASR